MSEARKYWPLGLQAIFVLGLAFLSATPIPFEFSRPMKAALTLWVAGLAFLIARTGFVALKAARPLSRFVSSLQSERSIFIRALKLTLICGLAIALYGWAKSMIPHVTSYWADPVLADLDKGIFGQDPWRLFRSRALGSVYVIAYLSWFGVTFGTLGVIAFSRRDHSRLILSYLLTIVLGGTIGQYVLPSAGPMYYQRIGFGDRFSELVSTNDPIFNGFADYLWHYYQLGGAGLGTGISAMPSMHVSLAVWTVFAAHVLWRPLVIPAALYALILWCASIASGWHYASDGIVGAGVAVLAYWAVARKPTADPVESGSVELTA